ncbi:MAG: FeoB-associated Cys-rich membrane protein [Desulfomonile tiedjei]|nr:FeoB-associated Cys-rich membrane protein [Desulfomonile tiedjei]
MWQEIAVGLVVAGSVIFMALRVRKNLAAARNAEAGCECSSCACQGEHESPCRVSKDMKADR